MGTAVKCPYCRTSQRVERSGKITCPKCRGDYKTEFRDTLAHQKGEFGEIPFRCYVTPLMNDSDAKKFRAKMKDER